MVEVVFTKPLSFGRNLIPRVAVFHDEDFYVDQRGFIRIYYMENTVSIPFGMVENWSRQDD